ncbi:MAG: hypothetical protein AAFV53_00680 [Myxococcota bacterium]
MHPLLFALMVGCADREPTQTPSAVAPPPTMAADEPVEKGRHIPIITKGIEAILERANVTGLTEDEGNRHTISAPEPDRLAHEAYRGRIGPFEDAVIYVRSPEAHTSPMVAWIVGEVDEEWTAYPTVIADAAHNVAAIDFENLDQDQTIEPIILLSTAPGIGPNPAIPTDRVVILQWAGEAFQRVEYTGEAGPVTKAGVWAALRKEGRLK